MLIRIFVDTNNLYVNDNQIIKNPVNFGIFDKIRRYLYTDHIKNATRMYISETVMNELLYKNVKTFNEEKAKLEKENERLKKVFGDNLISKGKVKWDNSEDFKKYVVDEIKKFIDSNDDIYRSRIPKDLHNLFERAFNKQPLFVEATGAGKKYTDAGLKDNLLLEEVRSSLDLNDIGIILTKDNDFSSVNEVYNNIFVTKIENLELLLEEKIPKYKYYRIIHKLNIRDTLMNLNDIYSLQIDNIETFRFISFDENYCVYDEEESCIELKLIAKDDSEKRTFITKYDLIANEVIYMEEDNGWHW